ncbi:MAG: glycosyltransferase [Candidatus Sulfopaludibacter sp.]|nr:glycosyltransferase [Candidatus Sulfopaludibacter sp.]
MVTVVATTEPHATALRIVSSLKPASVLGIGNATGPLLQSLVRCGVAVRQASSVEQLANLRDAYDLAVYSGSIDQAGSLIAGAAGCSQRILFFPSFGAGQDLLMMSALRLFDEAGFSPDFATDPVFLTGSAVLFRRGGTELPASGLPLALELIRLNSLVQECLSQVSRIQDRLGIRSTPPAMPAPPSPPDRQAELERLLNELSATVAETREMQQVFAERMEGRVALLQSRTMRVQHATQAILRSRTWRTLVAGGGVLLRLQNSIRRFTLQRPSPEPANGATDGETLFRIACDEPVAASPPLSGTVSLRGWALASTGIRRLEIRAGDVECAEARYGFYRPDVAAHYPDVPGSDRSGFRAKLDTGLLPDGRQFLTLRAFSVGGATTERRVPIVVDHVNGYVSDYHRWIAEFEQEDDALIQMKVPLFAQRPVISVLLPVFRTPLEILERTLASVEKQSYPHWQLCIADDGSQSAEIDAMVRRHCERDHRIQSVRLPGNQGISAASNTAMGLAAGEFVALLDHDDELAPHALYHFVDALNRNREGDIFYSDEDQIDEGGLRSDPFFKPDWSPDLILAENYVNHLMICRRSLALEVGGFRSNFDLSQDHDILLRMSVRARRIVHIPRILYHWRTGVHSMRRASQWEHRAIDSSRRVIIDHLAATGIRAAVEPGEIPVRWRVRYAIPDNQRVQILIPSARVELLEPCLRSIAQRTDYRDYEIAILDNSHAKGIEHFVQRWNTKGRPLKYLDFRHRPFNFSALNNAAARETDAPLLLFLNDDITVITPGWLTAMVELASRPEVGAVGAKLLYPDGTLQHSGVVMGLFDICGHAFKGSLDEERQYFDFPNVIRNVSAVTGACMMVPAKRFWECGGFDEEALPIAYQDVDLCLKLGQRGYRVLVTPHARLYHHEASSKRPEDKDPTPSEAITLQMRWKDVIEQDPFYSPNLTRNQEDYSYRKRV